MKGKRERKRQRQADRQSGQTDRDTRAERLGLGMGGEWDGRTISASCYPLNSMNVSQTAIKSGQIAVGVCYHEIMHINPTSARLETRPV